MEEQNERDEEIKAVSLEIFLSIIGFTIQATEKLSKAELQEYKDIFSFFDRDGGGSITSVELGQVMRTLGWDPSEIELQELISQIDQDGNGVITFNEFVWFSTK
jgi:calmodulin